MQICLYTTCVKMTTISNSILLMTLNTVFFENDVLVLQERNNLSPRNFQILNFKHLFCIFRDRFNDDYINQISIIMYMFHNVAINYITFCATD